jgi:hypothetical protein
VQDLYVLLPMLLWVLDLCSSSQKSSLLAVREQLLPDRWGKTFADLHHDPELLFDQVLTFSSDPATTGPTPISPRTISQQAKCRLADRGMTAPCRAGSADAANEKPST